MFDFHVLFNPGLYHTWQTTCLSFPWWRKLSFGNRKAKATESIEICRGNIFIWRSLVDPIVLSELKHFLAKSVLENMAIFANVSRQTTISPLVCERHHGRYSFLHFRDQSRLQFVCQEARRAIFHHVHVFETFIQEFSILPPVVPFTDANEWYNFLIRLRLPIFQFRIVGGRNTRTICNCIRDSGWSPNTVAPGVLPEDIRLTLNNTSIVTKIWDGYVEFTFEQIQAIPNVCRNSEVTPFAGIDENIRSDLQDAAVVLFIRVEPCIVQVDTDVVQLLVVLSLLFGVREDEYLLINGTILYWWMVGTNGRSHSLVGHGQPSLGMTLVRWIHGRRRVAWIRHYFWLDLITCKSKQCCYPQTVAFEVLWEQHSRQTWTYFVHYFPFGKQVTISICTTTSRIVHRVTCFQPFLFKTCTTTSTIVQRVDSLPTRFCPEMYHNKYNCTEVSFSELLYFKRDVIFLRMLNMNFENGYGQFTFAHGGADKIHKITIAICPNVWFSCFIQPRPLSYMTNDLFCGTMFNSHVLFNPGVNHTWQTTPSLPEAVLSSYYPDQVVIMRHKRHILISQMTMT